MIKKLSLIDFGKFQNATFDLGPVTVVYGPNEAGKTTWFDGLFQALCSPSETKKIGKLLKSRYGSGRRATVETLSDGPITADSISTGSITTGSISEDEFMNLYSIRAGDLNLDLAPGSDWMEKLKSRLFHGGIDPKILIEEFEKLSSDKRTFVHNKNLEAVADKLAKARLNLEGRRREREALLGREKTLESLSLSIQETARLREQEDKKLAQLDSDLAFEEKIQTRLKWVAQLARLSELEKLEKESQELAPFRDARREDWDRLKEALRISSGNLQIEQGKIEAQGKHAASAKADYRALEARLESSKRRAQLATTMVDAVRVAIQARAGAGRPLVFGWVAAGFLIAAGGWLGSVFHGLVALAATLLALVSAGGAVYAGWRRKKFLSTDKLQASMAIWKDQWRLAEGLDAIADIATPEGFLLAMDACVREHEIGVRQEQEALHRLKALELEWEQSEATLDTAKKAVESAHNGQKAWLEQLGIADGEAYLRKASRLAVLEAELPKHKAEFESSSTDTDRHTLEREMLRKLQTLDEQGIPDRGRDDAGMQRLRQERKTAQLERERLVKEEEAMRLRREGMAGEIRGAVGNLAQDIVAGEDAVVTLEAEIQSKELDKRAAALALSIFRTMGDGADQLLAGLAGEMETMLKNILPNGNERGLALPGLSVAQIEVQDALGKSRPLEHLSTGTRDAVVLAAKLALALKSRQSPGVLVLDEPFLAMDAARESRALQWVLDFQSRHQWQVILLSKQVQLKDAAMQLFPKAVLVNLV